MRVTYTTPTDHVKTGEFVGLLPDEHHGWMAVIRTENPLLLVHVHPSRVLLGTPATTPLLSADDYDNQDDFVDLMCQRLIANGFKV